MVGLGEKDEEYVNSLGRLLIFLEGNRVLDLAPLPRHTPQLADLTLFGWEHIRVEPDSWRRVAANLVRLELVGIGFNATKEEHKDDEAELRMTFDCDLLWEAKSLRSLRIAGWGDSSVELDTLLAMATKLDTLYLEDIKVHRCCLYFSCLVSNPSRSSRFS